MAYTTPEMSIDPVENKAKALRGELYYAFTPELLEERRRCQAAVQRFNDARNASRREFVRLFREYTSLPIPHHPIEPS